MVDGDLGVAIGIKPLEVQDYFRPKVVLSRYKVLQRLLLVRLDDLEVDLDEPLIVVLLSRVLFVVESPLCVHIRTQQDVGLGLH